MGGAEGSLPRDLVLEGSKQKSKSQPFNLYFRLFVVIIHLPL